MCIRDSFTTMKLNRKTRFGVTCALGASLLFGGLRNNAIASNKNIIWNKYPYVKFHNGGAYFEKTDLGYDVPTSVVYKMRGRDIKPWGYDSLTRYLKNGGRLVVYSCYSVLDSLSKRMGWNFETELQPPLVEDFSFYERNLIKSEATKGINVIRTGSYSPITYPKPDFSEEAKSNGTLVPVMIDKNGNTAFGLVYNEKGRLSVVYDGTILYPSPYGERNPEVVKFSNNLADIINSDMGIPQVYSGLLKKEEIRLAGPYKLSIWPESSTFGSALLRLYLNQQKRETVRIKNTACAIFPPNPRSEPK